MIATVLGREGFRAGMDLYFERHDGEAATVEDFIRCFEDAAGADLKQFRPLVLASRDAGARRRLKVTMRAERPSRWKSSRFCPQRPVNPARNRCIFR